ncbi:hypothetical protein [Methylobacterium sp. sgz302541]|uniref:hypothetical protein n=1 Tax=unclassified Methylobacterium TaxID=2615210 RepID=UPI003D34DE18
MRPTQSPNLDRHDLLIDFLAGSKRAHGPFFKAFMPVMLCQARKIAPDLPADLWQDIIQGAFLILVQTNSSKYDPTKGSPEAFVGLAVWDAMRRVRSEYAAPGQMTRRENERKKKGASSTSTPPAPTDPFVPPAPPQVIAFDDLSAEIAGGMEEFAAVEHRLDAVKIMARAERQIATALGLIHWEDASKGDAAAHVALPRTTLNDRLKAFGRLFAIAA